MEWLGAYAAVNIDAVISELLYVKASNEELIKRITFLEGEVAALADRLHDRQFTRYVPSDAQG